MKFTLNWLKEYLSTNATCEQICEKLTQIGLEVEDVMDNAKNLKDFNCVLVEKAEKIEGSDHLNLCIVKTAKNETLKIVCGAPNVKSGVKAILAPIGSIIPSTGLKLTKKKILGIEGEGMLCSEKELGLGDDHNGILLVSDDTPLGKNIAEIQGLDDVLIDIAITPNRGDSLGVYGIARGLYATGIGELKEFKKPTIKETIKNKFNIKLETNNCDGFAIRYIQNVKNCESPNWLKKKLIAVGFTPKSALVDITNYVMWILNRPLHCYDADKINGDFVIKNAMGGEKFSALDKNEYIIPKDAVLISNTNNEIMGLAGIIGGMKTATELTTTNVALECAVFNPIVIATIARKINLNTDAKYRFERGIDYATTGLAIDYATSLILEICGGEVSEIVSKNNKDIQKNSSISFLLTDISAILGVEIPINDVKNILTKLGYKVEIKENDINVMVPTWRNDISIKENVIEDIIRIYGYENLEPQPLNDNKVGEDEVNKYNRQKSEKMWEVNKLLAGNGMSEVISYSFISEKDASEFITLNNDLKLLNPITADMTYMRPSLIPNMLNIIKYNGARGIENIAIFENGKIFLGTEPKEQKQVLTGIRYGLTTDKNVFKNSRNYDIYDVKKDLFDVLSLFNINAENLPITNDFPDYYHPVRSGAIKMGNLFIGVFGEINPMKVAKFDIKGRVNAFELYLDNIPKMKPQTTQKKRFVLNELQAIYRDFAFIIDKNIEIGKVIDIVKKVDKELIKEVNLFDIYEGEKIAQEKKSIAFSIKIQPTLKPMVTEEIDIISNKIIKEMESKIGGELRK